MEPRTARPAPRTDARPDPRSDPRPGAVPLRLPTSTAATGDPLGTAVPDLLADDVAEAVRDLLDGRSTRARRRLGALWTLAPVGSVHRSALAHWLAVADPAPATALRWHEQALEAAEAAGDWSVPFAATALTLGEMYPELHLDLARAYQQVGDACGALDHLALARNAFDVTVRGERRIRLGRLAAQLDALIDEGAG